MIVHTQKMMPILSSVLVLIGFSWFSVSKNLIRTCLPQVLYTHLEPALDEIEGRDGGVGDAARQDAAQAAQRKVLGRPELARVLLRGRRRQRAAARRCCDCGGGVRVLERAREEVAAARFAHAEHVHLEGGVVSGRNGKGVHVVIQA